MSAWKAREIRKPGKPPRSQAERVERDREKEQIEQTHRRLREEFLARDERRRAA